MGYGICGLLPRDFYELTLTELWVMSKARSNYEAFKWGKYKPKLKHNNKKTLEWLKEGE